MAHIYFFFTDEIDKYGNRTIHNYYKGYEIDNKQYMTLVNSGVPVCSWEDKEYPIQTSLF